VRLFLGPGAYLPKKTSGMSWRSLFRLVSTLEIDGDVGAAMIEGSGSKIRSGLDSYLGDATTWFNVCC